MPVLKSKPLPMEDNYIFLFRKLKEGKLKRIKKRLGFGRRTQALIFEMTDESMVEIEVDSDRLHDEYFLTCTITVPGSDPNIEIIEDIEKEDV